MTGLKIFFGLLFFMSVACGIIAVGEWFTGVGVLVGYVVAFAFCVAVGAQVAEWVVG